MLILLAIAAVLALFAAQFAFALVLTIIRVVLDLIQAIVWILTFPIHRGEPRKGA